MPFSAKKRAALAHLKKTKNKKCLKLGIKNPPAKEV